MKISGYTYVKNAVEMDYPFRESIKSMLNCCDEVVVIDASNKDNDEGTKDALNELMKEFKHLNVYEVEMDWAKPNFGIYDGQLKQIARSMCTGEYLIQFDSDEIIEDNARPKIEKLVGAINGLNPPAPPLVACPVIEYWGSQGKVRIDVNPWKWRISKNDSNIIHGIPVHLRKIENDLLYAMPGTDGCDYINKEDGNIIPCANFINNDIESLRRMAVFDKQSAIAYQNWFNVVVNELPTFHHYSWWSIYRKMKTYELFWTDFWKSLYNDHSKPATWNPFFEDRDLKTISDAEKLKLAIKLEEETGGHIFHLPWSGLKTNSVQIHSSPIPSVIKDWCINHKTPTKLEE